MNYKRLLGIIMATLLIVVSVFTGCSKKPETPPQQPTIEGSVDDGNDIIGVIVKILSDHYEVNEYSLPTSQGKIDPAAIDVNTLVKRGSTQRVNFPDSKSYYKLENGELKSVLPANFREGCLILRNTAENGKAQMILIKENFENVNRTTYGQVIALVAGSYFAVNLYENPGDIEDFTKLDPSSLKKTTVQGQIYLDNDAVDIEGDSVSEYFIVENGELKPYTKEEIKNGDIIVGTAFNDIGCQKIIVLKKAE